MKKILCLLASLTLCLALFTGCGADSTTTETTENNSTSGDVSQTEETDTDDSSETASATDAELLSGTHHAEIEVKDYGTISLELYADIAPITVTNFINLANEGFYDGLTFHRIIEGFMIQGGDPLGNGTGGSDQTIEGEFLYNGHENTISHVRGVISMARSQDYNSASSQFFIMHQDYTGLDGQYAAFGIVTDGMDVVDKIAEDAIVEDSNGTVAAENQPVITTIRVID
jgi:peptidyl-prolyl cis-trans isomerase B (cyclophilin B)